MDDREKDALDSLEALVTSDGWRRVCAFVEREWGNDNLAARINAMQIENPGDLQLQLAEFLAAKRATALVLQWPLTMLQDMKQRMEGAPVARGASRM